MPNYISSRDDVINRLGSPEVVRQLLDPGKTGSLNYAVVDLARQDSAGDVQATLESKFKLYADGNYPQKIQRLDAKIAIKHLYANLRAPAPADVLKDYGEAIRQLERIEAGESAPGSPFAQTRLHRTVDNSDGGRRATYSAFRRGGLLGAR